MATIRTSACLTLCCWARGLRAKPSLNRHRCACCRSMTHGPMHLSFSCWRKFLIKMSATLRGFRKACGRLRIPTSGCRPTKREKSGISIVTTARPWQLRRRDPSRCSLEVNNPAARRNTPKHHVAQFRFANVPGKYFMSDSSNNSLQGKIAVVTGAATGLGKQVAIKLVEAGARVAILGRTQEKLDALAKSLGPSALPVVADVADPDQVRSAFEMVDRHFGPVDILVNNAAIYVPFRIEDADDQGLINTISTNLLGAAFCIREATKRMKVKGQGDIINVSSESTRNPFPYLTVYAARKAGLETLSAGLRSELHEYGIRVAVLRVGRMKGLDANASLANWKEGELEQALALWDKTGHNAFTGAGMDTSTVAGAVLNALTLPREANMDVFEV